MKQLRKSFFTLLSKLNKAFLPKAYNLDLDNLSKKDKILIGVKYWITKNLLENK